MAVQSHFGELHAFISLFRITEIPKGAPDADCRNRPDFDDHLPGNLRGDVNTEPVVVITL